MKHFALTPFGGQPVTAAHLAALDAVRQPPAPRARLDKWSIFNDLRSARKSFGLSDRDLSVLYALLTFLPGTELSPEAALTVFPSNRALAERAHGMAESTLRRHLAALVAAGMIWRNDSPNGKRFARRDASGALSQAYGFDLAPLYHRAAEITCRAEALEEAARQQHLARERLVLTLRDASKLLAHALATGRRSEAATEEATLASIRAGLRRKLDLADLLQMQDAAQAILTSIYPEAFATAELSASAAQNERHHSNSDKELIDLEQTERQLRDPAPMQSPAAENQTAPQGNQTAPCLPLALVLSACPELAPYSAEPPRNWRELETTAATLRGMMGIPQSVWSEARSAMGPENASITLAAILQRFSKISNPAGYLRSLSRRAAAGAFSPVRMILALIEAPERPICES